MLSRAIFLPIDEYVAATLPLNMKAQLCRNSFSGKKLRNLKERHSIFNKKCLNFVILGGEPYQKGIDLALMAVNELRQEHQININISIMECWQLILLKQD